MKKPIWILIFSHEIFQPLYREEYGYECYDTIEDQYFRAGDKWTTVRNLTDHTGVVAGVSAYYSCTCEGGDTGRYICRPTGGKIKN